MLASTTLIPLWLVRVTSKMLLLGPLLGHHGFGEWSSEAVWHHYVHHTKFSFNFGASPLWDHLCHTHYLPVQHRRSGNQAEGPAQRSEHLVER